MFCVCLRCKISMTASLLIQIVTCSIGDRHLGFIDEYNRAFVVGNNRYGQLGTGDRMDRSTPVQVLFNKAIKILHCR